MRRPKPTRPRSRSRPPCRGRPRPRTVRIHTRRAVRADGACLRVLIHTGCELRRLKRDSPAQHTLPVSPGRSPDPHRPADAGVPADSCSSRSNRRISAVHLQIHAAAALGPHRTPRRFVTRLSPESAGSGTRNPPATPRDAAVTCVWRIPRAIVAASADRRRPSPTSRPTPGRRGGRARPGRAGSVPSPRRQPGRPPVSR